jgi:hypothetical protein
VSVYVNSSSAYVGMDRPIRHVDQMPRLRRIQQRRNGLLVLSSNHESERVARSAGLTVLARGYHVLLGPPSCGPSPPRLVDSPTGPPADPAS